MQIMKKICRCILEFFVEKKKQSKLNFGEITLKKEMKMCDCEVTSSDRASMVENPPEQQFFRSSLTPKIQYIHFSQLTIHNCWCYMLHYMKNSFFCDCEYINIYVNQVNFC